jgi:hypothetical protein
MSSENEMVEGRELPANLLRHGPNATCLAEYNPWFKLVSFPFLGSA